MSVCGIIPVSLWEKFGEQSIVLDNSRQFVGKIQWTKVQCWIIPVSLWEKITGLFTSICRGTASHNVYLTENSPKLKTVYTSRMKAPGSNSLNNSGGGEYITLRQFRGFEPEAFKMVKISLHWTNLKVCSRFEPVSFRGDVQDATTELLNTIKNLSRKYLITCHWSFFLLKKINPSSFPWSMQNDDQWPYNAVR